MGGGATRVVTGGGRTARAAAGVGLVIGERRPGAGDSTATPPVDRPTLLGAVGTAVTERETDRAGRPWFARPIAGLAARGVGVAGDETAVRASGTGVVVSGKPVGTGVVVIGKPTDTGVPATADAAGVRLAVGTRGAAAVAVLAAPPTAPPLPVAPAVATAGAVRVPGLRGVTVVVAVGPPARRLAVVAVGPPAKRLAVVIVLAAPLLEVVVADAPAAFAGAGARPVAPDRVPKAETVGGVPLIALAVPTAPGPLPPTAPTATRAVARAAVGWDDAARDRATGENSAVAAEGGRDACPPGDRRTDGVVIAPITGGADVVTRRA